MYTRSRQSQNFTGNQQQQRAGGNMQQQQREQYNQQPYNQHGNYQGGNQNQQNYNQGGGGTPYKQQPQQQQQQPQTPLQHSTPQPQRLKPILKSSGGNNVQGTPVQGQNNQQFNQNQSQNQNQNQNQQQNFQPQQTNNGTESNNDDVQNESMEGDSQEVPKWRRKIPGLKVNRKLKRLRMNQRLRKTIQPKNAIMVLNEMKTGVQFTFPETQTALPSSLFLVHAEIEGKTYIGQGISKPLARQNAAENALKSLLLEKMTAAAMKARVDGDPENENAGNVNTNANANDNADATTGEATENQDGETKMETEESDEIPWSSLASFALYKLFLEWQNQGTVVPVPRPGVPAGKVKKEQPVNKPVAPKELPANATTIHPVMLLNQMRPGLTYHEVSRVGNPPNTMFTLGVDVDGQEFTGAAKNKKDAKKMAAKAALNGLYGLVYPEEKEGEDVNMG